MIQRKEIPLESKEQYFKMREMLEKEWVRKYLGLTFGIDSYHNFTYHVTVKNPKKEDSNGVTLSAKYSPMSEEQREIIIIGEEDDINEVKLIIETKIFPDIKNQLERKIAQ